MQTRTVTTLEVLIGLMMVVVLAIVVVIAVDPSTSFADGSDAQRRNDIVALHGAIYQYQQDNGVMPIGVDSDPTTAQVLGVTGSGCSQTCGAIDTKDACLDISGLLVTEYLNQIPSDPDTGDFMNTDYYVNKTASGKLLVGACDPVNIGAINVIR